MQIPRQSAAVLRSQRHAVAFLSATPDGVTPQARVCTPCLRIGGGRWCVNLPIVGRKCFNVPSVGSWKACCRVRLGWPPVSCGIERC